MGDKSDHDLDELMGHKFLETVKSFEIVNFFPLNVFLGRGNHDSLATSLKTL